MIEDLEDLEADTQSDRKDLAAAIVIRSKEKGDDVAEAGELSETISVIERAITIIEKEMAKSPSLLQAQTVGNLAQVFQVLVKASFLSTATPAATSTSISISTSISTSTSTSASTSTSTSTSTN